MNKKETKAFIKRMRKLRKPWDAMIAWVMIIVMFSAYMLQQLGHLQHFSLLYFWIAWTLLCMVGMEAIQLFTNKETPIMLHRILPRLLISVPVLWILYGIFSGNIVYQYHNALYGPIGLFIALWAIRPLVKGMREEIDRNN